MEKYCFRSCMLQGTLPQILPGYLWMTQWVCCCQIPTRYTMTLLECTVIHILQSAFENGPATIETSDHFNSWGLHWAKSSSYPNLFVNYFRPVRKEITIDDFHIRRLCWVALRSLKAVSFFRLVSSLRHFCIVKLIDSVYSCTTHVS